MKVHESFEISERRERVWEFFERPEQVAACVPGVESVEAIDDDQLRLQLTQSVGPMIATFALKMKITERVEQEAIEFTAIGRVVKGASGNVRSTNQVRLSSAGNGQTRVDLDADIAMGGMLGSVGQKVIAKQAKTVTKDFAGALEGALRGEPPPAEGAKKKREVREAPPAAAEATPPPDSAEGIDEEGGGLGIAIKAPDWPMVVAGAAAVWVLAWLLGRRAGANAAHARILKQRYMR